MTEAPPPTIRRATPDDAQAVSRLATRTFAETFGHLYIDDDLQALGRRAYRDPAEAGGLTHRDT
ncbi:MAG: hypothetical protein ACOH1R_01435 [Luteimonas sp.]